MQTTSERKVKMDRDANIFGKAGLTAWIVGGRRPQILVERKMISDVHYYPS